MESAIFELEMWRQEKTHAKTFDYLDSHTRHVLTFLNMDNEEDAMRKLLRYQTAARRAYNSAFKQLQALQGDGFDRQPSSLPEPILESPQTDPQPEQEPSANTPKVIVFAPHNVKLQSEPEHVPQPEQPSRDCSRDCKERTDRSPCAHDRPKHENFQTKGESTDFAGIIRRRIQRYTEGKEVL